MSLRVKINRPIMLHKLDQLVINLALCWLLGVTLAQRPCDMHKMNDCPDPEYCEEISTGKAFCTNSSGHKPAPSISPIEHEHHSNGWSPAWVIVPISLIAFIGALVILAKRYKLTERLYAFRVRRYNTVFVTSANVDDDAPIT